MAGSVNKAIIVGNLGADPDIRTTSGGQSVATLSIATSEKFKDREGNQQERTEWHRVVLWGKQAELAAQYLSKGRSVYVEGRIQTRSWDDAETGHKRYSTEIVADPRGLVFLSGGDGGGGRQQGQGGGWGQSGGYGGQGSGQSGQPAAPQRQPQQQGLPDRPDPLEDESIPF